MPAKPGSEEYLQSEKYQLRVWDRDDPRSLAPLLTALNRIRYTYPALQTNETLRFHAVDNVHLIAYSKSAGDSTVLTVVNLDPDAAQTGWTDLDLLALGVPFTGAYEVEDLLTGAKYPWNGSHNYVALDPETSAAHILLIRRATLSESLAGESTED